VTASGPAIVTEGLVRTFGDTRVTMSAALLALRGRLKSGG
jgi:5-enolpyruvylshikimate-3-phosphate synthase